MSQDGNDSLRALSEIALAINSVRETQPLLNKILETAARHLDAERGFILLKSSETSAALEVSAAINLTEDEIADLSRISTSVVQKVISKGEPVILYETQKDPLYRDSDSIVLQRIQSIACIPLNIRDKQIGAIYLDSILRRGRFTPEQAPFLSAFANQAAIAIENNRMHDTLRQENRKLRSEVQRQHGFDEIVGRSPKMREVFDVLKPILDSEVTVLIQGESGTGKELVARAIHYNGVRKSRPFMALFCGSLPENLLESELFGHKRGAFTGAVTDKKGLFEAADGGTFFLDEVGDLGLAVQAKLLRVLQEGEIKRIGENHIRKVDVRIISASNKNLDELVDSGLFREDLYYRLNTLSITMPSLRDRRDDIALLAHHFLDKYAAKKTSIQGFSDDAMEALRTYSWPGNVRELENAVERAVVLAKNTLITRPDLRLPADRLPHLVEAGLTLKEMTRRVVQHALNEHNNNVSEVARVLDVSRRWLHYKMKEWELQDK